MFHSIFGQRTELTDSVSPSCSRAELQARVESLSDDETQVYQWLRQYYTERWIAETLLVSRLQLKSLIKNLCRKLGVSGVRSLLRVYGWLPVAGHPETVDTAAIDGYVEARTEKEIRRQLQDG